MRASSLLRGTSACLFALSLAVAALACGDDIGKGDGSDVDPPAAGECYLDPLACDDGTVCGFDDEDGASMSCLPAGPGGKGATCKNVAGKPECSQGLACLQLKGTKEGQCTPFCDNVDVECSDGLECATITTDGGKTFFACAKI